MLAKYLRNIKETISYRNYEIRKKTNGQSKMYAFTELVFVNKYLHTLFVL